MQYYNLAISDIERYKLEMNTKKYSQKKVSIQDICEEMRNIPKMKPGLNLIQQIICRDEPDKSKLNKIKNKKDKKIPRKYLILFFIFTWGDGNYQESMENLNEELDKCGMPRLDSRNPFDWIIMSSFQAAATGDEGAIDRFKRMISAVYNITEDAKEMGKK